MQQGSHRPCSSCYIMETHLADLAQKSVVRTVELHRRVMAAIQSADDSKAVKKIKGRWSTHPVQVSSSSAETTWGNVFLTCAADILHVLDGGMLPCMGKCFMVGKSKPKRREFERWVWIAVLLTLSSSHGRRRKEQKKDTRASVVRIPGGTTWFSTGANYAAFEHRGMKVMPLLIADNMEKSKPPAKLKRKREVAAFVAYASFYKALVGVTKHTNESLDDGTVKVPVRGSNWHDIPHRIVEEEVQREIAREVAADAGGNRQYVMALREVHTAVAIPRTRGGELVPKSTFVKASPSERWFSDIAVLNPDEEEWYARCLCIFRATGADGAMGRHMYVKYYEAEGTCPMTTCLQLSPGRVRTRYAVVEVECIQRVVHMCKSYVNKHVMLLNRFLLTE
ncbi:unnamed protein product [Closterium sp. NIES-64]|nr:unnamed protein product [Closterium sp. NIES-64]